MALKCSDGNRSKVAAFLSEAFWKAYTSRHGLPFETFPKQDLTHPRLIKKSLDQWLHTLSSQQQTLVTDLLTDLHTMQAEGKLFTLLQTCRQRDAQLEEKLPIDATDLDKLAWLSLFYPTDFSELLRVTRLKCHPKRQCDIRQDYYEPVTLETGDSRIQQLIASLETNMNHLQLRGRGMHVEHIINDNDFYLIITAADHPKDHPEYEGEGIISSLRNTPPLQMAVWFNAQLQIVHVYADNAPTRLLVHRTIAREILGITREIPARPPKYYFNLHEAYRRLMTIGHLGIPNRILESIVLTGIELHRQGRTQRYHLGDNLTDSLREYLREQWRQSDHWREYIPTEMTMMAIFAGNRLRPISIKQSMNTNLGFTEEDRVIFLALQAAGLLQEEKPALHQPKIAYAIPA